MSVYGLKNDYLGGSGNTFVIPKPGKYEADFDNTRGSFLSKLTKPKQEYIYVSIDK